MSRHQSHGRRVVTMGDQWRAILDRADEIVSQPRPAPIQPCDHLSAAWCTHGWACRACPPDRRRHPDDGTKERSR